MEVFVNNKPFALEEESTVAGLIHALKMQSRAGIAVAIEGQVVAQKEWDSRVLQQGEQIMIITATQGG